MIARYGGIYAFGDMLTSADCHIVPQVYSANRFDVPLDAYPKLMRVVAIPEVAAAHPDETARCAIRMEAISTLSKARSGLR